MTRSEALALARAKWGEAGEARDYFASLPGGYYAIVFVYQTMLNGRYVTRYQREGTGDSWESACRAAGLLPDTASQP